MGVRVEPGCGRPRRGRVPPYGLRRSSWPLAAFVPATFLGGALVLFDVVVALAALAVAAIAAVAASALATALHGGGLSI